jgi:hypothetical protein
MDASFATIDRGEGPLVVTAIHDGHDVRPDVERRMRIDDQRRLYEEDPYTGRFTPLGDTGITVHRSRFEVDLNRPRYEAVYRGPKDAWGLDVWKEGEPPRHVIETSQQEHDAFYAEAERVFEALKAEYGAFVVIDMHTYNHRRDGPDGPPADPATNPEINIGTASMNRDRWSGLIDRFMGDLRAFDFRGRSLDVRENVKFIGGEFSRWIHERFPAAGCSINVELKKTFMDEWTGELDEAHLNDLYAAIASTVPGVREELARYTEAQAAQRTAA